jgi:hypothetical protein
MSPNKLVNSVAFWIALLLIIVAFLIFTATWLGWFRLTYVISGESIHHWFSWTGAGFIAVYLPIYAVLKRRYQGSIKTLLPIHVFGNLLSFVFISIHFSHHVTRPAQAYPDLGTGIALYTAAVILIITGFILRFQLDKKGWKSWRWLHTGMMLSFYLVVILHILHGLTLI